MRCTARSGQAALGQPGLRGVRARRHPAGVSRPGAWVHTRMRQCSECPPRPCQDRTHDGLLPQEPECTEAESPAGFAGAAALIEREGSLLLDRRLDPPGWALVAGRMEDHESLADALQREVREETGLVVTDYQPFGVFSHPSRIVQYADGNTSQVITVAFSVEVEDFGHLHRSAESKDLRFVTREDLRLLDLVVTHRPIIDCYLSDGTPPYLD
jgi:ADP-ribose pyrophosphatase YjhB (NUDIX family)